MWQAILKALVSELENNPALITKVIDLIQSIVEAAKANPELAKDLVSMFK